MSRIELSPSYSTMKIPGRCLKCLAEEEYGSCTREMLKGNENDKDLQDKLEALLSLLESPEMLKMRDESEKLLADGKNVTIVIDTNNNENKYYLKIEE